MCFIFLHESYSESLLQVWSLIFNLHRSENSKMFQKLNQLPHPHFFISFLTLRIIKMLKLKIMNKYLQHLFCTKQLVFTVQCFTVQCFMHNPIWIEAGI